MVTSRICRAANWFSEIRNASPGHRIGFVQMRLTETDAIAAGSLHF
jgi:hypothetical protein